MLQNIDLHHRSFLCSWLRLWVVYSKVYSSVPNYRASCRIQQNEISEVGYDGMGRSWNKQGVSFWCSGYHCCKTSFSKAWTQVLRRFKSCTRRGGSLAMVPAGNKAERLSLVNHTIKTIHLYRKNERFFTTNLSL